MIRARNPFKSTSSGRKINPNKHLKLIQFGIATCSLLLLLRQPNFNIYSTITVPNEGIKTATQTHVHLTDVQSQSNQSQASPFLPTPPPESLWLLRDTIPNTTSIPPTLNKIYFQKNGHFSTQPMADNLARAHASWHELNPGYEVRYYNLNSARSYLKQHFHPVFLRTFDCIQAFAGKSDFFRMVLLYREGGFHSDWKEVCLKPNALQSIANETDFFAAVDFGFTYAAVTRSCAQNAFVGSIPRHSILAQYLQLAMVNVQNASYPENTLLATGPCLFGKAIKSTDDTFGQDATIKSGKYGQYKSHQFFWKEEAIVAHRCCGWGQNWGDQGNNYNTLFQERRYYCEDAGGIFDGV